MCKLIYYRKYLSKYGGKIYEKNTWLQRPQLIENYGSKKYRKQKLFLNIIAEIFDKIYYSKLK